MLSTLINDLVIVITLAIDVNWILQNRTACWLMQKFKYEIKLKLLLSLCNNAKLVAKIFFIFSLSNAWYVYNILNTFYLNMCACNLV